MAIDISSTTRRIVYTGSAGVGPYAFNFEVLAQTDLAVYFNNTELTLTTDYTVSISGDGTGSVTIVVGTNVPSTPTASDRITIVGDRTIQRTTDFTTGGPLFATSLNDEFDSQTIFVQQVLEQSDRSLRAPNTDPTTVNMVLPINTVRANKTLAFDANGDPVIGEQIGDYRGNWAASTAYNKRDLVKDTSNNNVYLCVVAHTSSGSQPISSNADSAKWDLIVDSASASGFADEAEAWAKKTDGIVESTEYSSKAWSIGGTGVTNTASRGAAKEWATKAEDSTVDGTEYSAKHYSAKASASASAASSSASSASTSASNASTSASNASTSATNASNSATAAASSASSAASSQAAAEAVFDNFDDAYLGAKASDPTLDNDGDALADGALYFDTTNNVMKVYDLGTTTWYQLTPTVVNQNNINTVAGISADVTTVAGISANVTTVAGIDSDVTAVAADATDIGTVATNIANVNATGTNIANVNTTATNIANVNTVAGISANVTTVAGDSADIQTVASNTANISTVAGISANVTTVAGISSDVTTVATNVSDVVTFATTYLGASASAPSTSTTGALYYNTSTNQLYVWDGSAWDEAAFNATGAVTSFNTRTGAVTLSAADVNTALGSDAVLDSDIGSTVQAYDATILKSADIGTTVQGYDADTAKYDDVTANFTGTLQNGGSNVVVDTDIGSTVQAYDADTAKYDDTTANFTGTLQNGGSNVVVDTDINSTVLGYVAPGTSGNILTSNGTSWTSEAPAASGGFDSGTLMLFQQTAAPTGWTKQTTHNDKALRVVSGTASSGGTVAFATAFASKTPTGSVSITSVTGSAGATTLTTPQIPSHSHSYTRTYGGEFTPGPAPFHGRFQDTPNTGAAGGGGSHTHPFSFSSGSGTFSGDAIDLAVQYVDLIIASKD